MSYLRQFSLAVMLVAGTALAVTAYLDTQTGSLRTEPEVGGVILEFGPSSYPMARPMRASRSRGVSKLGQSDRCTGLQINQSRTIATAATASGQSRPVSASFVPDQRAIVVLPASSAKVPAGVLNGPLTN